MKIIKLIAFLIVILSGCVGMTSPEEQMYEILEKTVTLEEEFQKQQDPLVEHEQAEQDLYNQIMSLGMKDFDEIVQLSNEALEHAEKREELIQKERQSIEKAQQEFIKVEDIVPTIKDEKIKAEAKKLVKTMSDRYEAHKQLYEAYMEGLALDKELYQMFQREDLTMEELEEHLTKINEAYERVLVANEAFNQKTEVYNELKLQFYQQAGLEVSKDGK
jgi:Putative cell-wall binding lipoprotein